MKDGISAFVEDVARCAESCGEDRRGAICFVLELSEQYSYIRLRDLVRPIRFLKQINSAPPRQVGTYGFRSELVDDDNPARHYMAFVFVGFWLPYLLGVPVLWAWEFLGFLRYRFTWSQRDVRLGYVGLKHGRAVRRRGPNVLAPLIAKDLGDSMD
ncbi:MAG: hypothetical protein AAF702_22680 [Chloroflexota bacterium]